MLLPDHLPVPSQLRLRCLSQVKQRLKRCSVLTTSLCFFCERRLSPACRRMSSPRRRGVSRMVSAATWVSTRVCGRLWQVLRSPGADLHHTHSTKQAVSYHFSSHKPRHRDKPRLKARLYGRATARSLGAPPEQLLRGRSPSLAILSESTKPSGQLTCAWDAAKSLQPVPDRSVMFINIKKHIHNNVNSEMGIAQVQPSRCNTASA